MKSNIKPVEFLYSFAGKIFKCSQRTIDQLNFALAFNMRTERYKKIE